MSIHQSNSSEQQNAEHFMLKSLEEMFGFQFEKNAELPVSVTVQPDAIDPTRKVVVEAYARIGRVKGAQLNKIKGDILKLALVGKELGSEWRKILCFASSEAAKYAQGKSWVAEAAKVFGIEVIVVELPVEQHEKVIQAQKRQIMVNPQQ